MLGNLKKKLCGRLSGTAAPWVIGALVVALMAASALAGAKLNGQRWAVKYERLQRSYESAQAQAQAVATQQTQANAVQTAQLDKTYFEEYQNAQKTADYWRDRVRTERVPVCTQTANHAETRTTGSLGNDPTANTGADRFVDVSSTAIIQLSESAKQMRAQVLYFQGKKSVDDVTVNGGSDANK